MLSKIQTVASQKSKKLLSWSKKLLRKNQKVAFKNPNSCFAKIKNLLPKKVMRCHHNTPDVLALFYRAVRVPCVGCPTWLDSIKHAWRNKYAMGALRAEHKGRKKYFLLGPARPGPISNKHALRNKHAMGASGARNPISVIARLKKARVSLSICREMCSFSQNVDDFPKAEKLGI